MNLNKLHNDIHEGALQLMAEHRAQLFAKARPLCDSDDEAEELVILTIDKAIRKINTYAGDGDILSWMTRILVNLHNDAHRSHVVRGTTVVDAAQLEQYAGADTRTEEQILANSDHDALREAIRQLEPEYRRLVALYYFNELSLREVAGFLNSSTSSVSRKLELARKILCSKLKTKLGRRPVAILATVLFGIGALFGAYQVGIDHAIKPMESPVVASASGQFQEFPTEPDCQQEPLQPQQEEITEMNQSEIAVTTVALSDTAEARTANTADGTPTIARAKPSQRRSGAVKQAVLSASILAAATGLAGNINWTGGAGDTDLSKPANWGVSTLSGTDSATINVNNQTFTLEKNTSFNTMTLDTTAKTATFDFSANPTNEVYLGTTSGDAFAPKASGMVFTFKGGVWRGTGNAVFNTTVGGNDSTTVLDGTIVTNFATLAFGYKSPSQQLTELKNGAQVYVANAENGNGAGSNSVLKVSGGSKLIASGGVRVSNRIGGEMEGKGFHKLIVEGEGSLLKTGTGKAQAGLRIGDTYMGCSVIVTNRATLSAKGLYFSSHHNSLWMSNATVTLSGSYLNLDGISNRLDLLDCDVSIDFLRVCGSYGRCCIRGNRGRITLPLFVNPGGNSWGKANEVEIWDTVVAADYGSCNSPVGRGNIYRLMRTAVVNTTGAGIFSSAVSKHELNLCGEGATGGVFRCSGEMVLASTQTNCWLRLMDGVRYENLTTAFYLGYRPKSAGVNDKGINSTIYIGTNSTMSLQKLYVGNTGHRVVIDSGTLETPEIKLNADNRVGGTQTNSVIFAGTHPKFLYTPSAAYSLPTAGGWYVFEVPPEGYEAAPLQVSKGLTIPDGAQVVVHADIEKLSRHFDGKGGLVPLMTGASITVSSGQLTAMTQALGQRGARFVVEGKTLYLRVSGVGGIVLIR